MSNYLDKEEFLRDIKAYKERKKHNPDEQISNYSANAIMMIATKLANRPNFSGYSYKQDMISDAIYTCLRYYDKFDPDHPKQNAFGYFTRIAWFSFLQRLTKEKKQVAIKSKILAQLPFDTFDVQDQDLDEDFKNSFTEFLQEHNYEVSLPVPKKGAKVAVDEDDPIVDIQLDEMLSMDIDETVIEECDVIDEGIDNETESTTTKSK